MVTKEVVLFLAFMAFVHSNPLEENFHGMDEVEIEPQEPVPFPELINPEDGETQADCQGFFVNVFGCRNLTRY